MPISEYFGGHGSDVMAEMKKKHGKKEGERIFYATANSRNEKPDSMSKHMDSEGGKIICREFMVTIPLYLCSQGTALW